MNKLEHWCVVYTSCLRTKMPKSESKDRVIMLKGREMSTLKDHTQRRASKQVEEGFFASQQQQLVNMQSH